MGFKIVAVFTVGILFSGQATEAAAKISVHRINGYTVILADIQQGNSTFIQLVTPNGCFHDPVKLAGIAHYTEHMMFNGTTANPGQTLGRLLSDIGAESNASTGYLATNYHSTQNQSSLLQALRYWGEAFSNPLFENAQTELETVIREVDGDDLNNDASLAEVFPPSLILPEGHPLHQVFFGTKKELSQIAVEDVKRTFLSHAGPGGLSIIVSGNFSTSTKNQISEDQVLETIRKHFVPPKIPADYEPYTRGDLQTFPPFSNQGNLPFIRIVSRDAKRTLDLRFLVPEKKASSDDQAYQVLLAFLNLNAPGTLIRKLKDAAFVTEASAIQASNGNIRLAYFSMTLTDKGYKHLNQVLDAFWQYLSQIRAHGIPETLLRLVIEDIQGQLEEAALDPEQLSNLIKSRLHLGADEAVRLTSKNAWEDISNARIKISAEALLPERSFVSLLAPDAPGSNESVIASVGGADPSKKRDALTRDSKKVVARWQDILNQPQQPLAARVEVVPHRLRGAKPLDFQARVARRISTSTTDFQVFLEEKHDISKAATLVRLQLPLLSVEQQACLEILVRGFGERFGSELAYFGLKNFYGLIEVGPNQMIVIGKGDPLGGLDFVTWFFERIADYRPSEVEIQSAKDRILNEASDFIQSRTGQIAISSAQSALLQNSPTILQIAEAANTLQRETIETHRGRLLRSGNFIVTGFGDLSAEELLKLEIKLRASIPNPLDAADLERIAQSLVTAPKTPSAWDPLYPPKNESDFGYVRAVAIHGRDPKTLALAEVLGEMLSTQVFEYNREAQSLGYIHRAKLTTLRGAPYLMMYGGVDLDDEDRKPRRSGLEKLELTQKGIEEVIAGLVGRSGVEKLNWTDEQIVKVVAGLIENLKQVASDPVEGVYEVLNDVLRTGDVLARERIAAELQAVSPADVRTFAHQMVLDRPYWEFVTSVPSQREACLRVLAKL